MLTGHSIKAVYLDTKGLDIAEIFTSCRADAPAGHHAGTTTADRLRVLGILKKAAVIPSAATIEASTSSIVVTASSTYAKIVINPVKPLTGTLMAAIILDIL